MAQQNKIGTVSTIVENRDTNHLSVTYHQTEVVKLTPFEIHLNTGGWFTVTTKTRMNQASNQYSLGYHVYQQKGKWYVSYKGKSYEFKNGSITLKR